MATGSLHFGDYIVFGVVTLVCIVIGIVSCILSRRKDTVVEFLFGSRKMAPFPVLVSMTLTFLTPYTMLGLPADVYYFGIEIVFVALSQAIGVALAAILFVPLLHPLQLTSTNQYLYMRYGSRTTQYLAAFLQLFQLVLAFILFTSGPAIVFDKVTDCPMWAATVVIGTTATVYTTLGGMRAELWGHLLQMVVMVTALLMVFVMATIKVGGPSSLWELFSYGDRLDIHLEPSLWRRSDIWGIGIFHSCLWFILFGVNQVSFQKYSSVPTMKKAAWTMAAVIPCVIGFTLIACFCGVATFAYYVRRGCNPLEKTPKGLLEFQGVLPHFVMEVFQYPAVRGIFITGVFCSSLSMCSQILTSLSAFTWDDFLSRRYINLSEGKKTYICKILVVLYGIACTALSYAMYVIQGPVFEIALQILPLLTVPLGVLFIVGATFARVNSINAIISSIISFCVVLVLLIGSLIHGGSYQPLPTMVEKCELTNFMNSSLPTNTVVDIRPIVPQNVTYDVIQHISNGNSSLGDVLPNGLFSPTSSMGVTTVTYINSTAHYLGKSAADYLWTISYTWYPFLGGLVGFLFALICSLCSGCKTKHEVDDRLLFACLRLCYQRHNHRYHVASYHDDATSEIEYEMSDIHRRKTPVTPQMTPKYDMRNTLLLQSTQNNNEDSQKALQKLL